MQLTEALKKDLEFLFPNIDWKTWKSMSYWKTAGFDGPVEGTDQEPEYYKVYKDLNTFEGSLSSLLAYDLEYEGISGLDPKLLSELEQSLCWHVNWDQAYTTLSEFGMGPSIADYPDEELVEIAGMSGDFEDYQTDILNLESKLAEEDDPVKEKDLYKKIKTLRQSLKGFIQSAKHEAQEVLLHKESEKFKKDPIVYAKSQFGKDFTWLVKDVFVVVPDWDLFSVWLVESNGPAAYANMFFKELPHGKYYMVLPESKAVLAIPKD